LKSPLNSIIGFSELLAEQIKGRDFDNIEEYANIIHQSSNRAMNLLMNLLAWAQSQSGRMEFNPVRFNIVPLINEVTLLLKDVAKQKSILIATSMLSAIQVNADKDMISTILRNLISNAIKYSQPEGVISISAIIKECQLIVSVIDSGIGISKDRIEKLFVIGEGISTPGTQSEKGTCLGLILCNEFIHKNKGEIWVESEVGVGSTFFFSLPLCTLP
jgi:two-component system sensor histidine kinase/response regulator